MKRKRLIMISICLIGVAILALMGAFLGKKVTKVERIEGETAPLRCAYDGTRINPAYRVDAFLDNGSTRSFCSIYCAIKWFEANKGKVIYFTVMDEVTGQNFDATLGYFVESDVITVPEVKNRIHAFSSKEDALKHAKQFNGKLIPNPFGEEFLVPKSLQFERLTCGAPLLPDALPIRMGIYKPIFKENRLQIELYPFEVEVDAERLLTSGSIDTAISDLPSAILLSRSIPGLQIVRNMLRPNPFEPIFAIAAGPKTSIQDLSGIKGKTIAVPRGMSFRFYLDFFLQTHGIPRHKVLLKEVSNVKEAWDLLLKGDVSASVLRMPYTKIAMSKEINFLADDRTLTWTSVLVARKSAIETKQEALKKFCFALGQSALALNIKAQEYRIVLEQQGGIPEWARRDFPMPTFEVSNLPDPDEIGHMVRRMIEMGYLNKEVPYEEIVNSQFIPNPDKVGLAICCS